MSYGSRMIRIYHGGEAQKQMAVMGARQDAEGSHPHKEEAEGVN